MTPTAQGKAGPITDIDWTLVSGTAKLTTRFLSVQITGQQSGGHLFGIEAPKVQVEIRAKGKCVSRPVSASYGFEDGTGEVQLRVMEDDSKKLEPNTVAVMLVEEIFAEDRFCRAPRRIQRRRTGDPRPARSCHILLRLDQCLHSIKKQHRFSPGRWSARILSARSRSVRMFRYSCWSTCWASIVRPMIPSL